MSETEKSHPEIEEYGDPGIASHEGGKVPRWLIAAYIILPIWGVISLYVYWNGSHGWLDRGYWGELQKAANTTYPVENMLQVEREKGSSH